MNDFDALIHALGESVVAYVGNDYLRSVSVVARKGGDEASIVLVPRDHDGETYDKIIDAMIEVRGLYLGEIHIDYTIADSDDLTALDRSDKAVFALS